MPLRLAFFVMMFAAAMAAKALAEDRNYCREDGKLVLFLVDTTTPYDEIDKAIVVETVDAAFLALKGGDRFSVRTITDSHARSEKLFERCLPVCDSDSALGGFFTCNDGLIKSDTRRLRNDMVAALKERLSRFSELQHSDIARTIDSAASEEIEHDRKTDLYIFSDLIENSDEMSGYELFNAGNRALLARLEANQLIPDLTGVAVRVAGVGRAGTADRRPLTARELNKLVGFWSSYFEAASAASVEIGHSLVRKARTETTRAKTDKD